MQIQIKKILMPTDFSEHSKSALPYACAFAEQFDAELTVVHVVEDVVSTVPDFGLPVTPPQEMLDSIDKSAEEGLAHWTEHGLKCEIKIKRAVLHGPPAHTICQYAQEQQIDLMIITSHGRTGLAHLLMGSVAERIVRFATCPVLTVGHSERQLIKTDQ